MGGCCARVRADGRRLLRGPPDPHPAHPPPEPGHRTGRHARTRRRAPHQRPGRGVRRGPIQRRHRPARQPQTVPGGTGEPQHRRLPRLLRRAPGRLGLRNQPLRHGAVRRPAGVDRRPRRTGNGPGARAGEDLHRIPRRPGTRRAFPSPQAHGRSPVAPAGLGPRTHRSRPRVRPQHPDDPGPRLFGRGAERRGAGGQELRSHRTAPGPGRILRLRGRGPLAGSAALAGRRGRLRRGPTGTGQPRAGQPARAGIPTALGGPSVREAPASQGLGGG